MALAWVGTAMASVLVLATLLWGCHEWQRRYEAGRIVKAVESRDEAELLMLLVEGADFDSVREWFGEPALILAVKRAGLDETGFAREAVSLFASHGASVNEPGTEWKTALMHAAGAGHWDLCATLLAHGADPAARDMFGRTAADWAQSAGHNRTASLLRTVEA